jgi:hypothetical protein
VRYLDPEVISFCEEEMNMRLEDDENRSKSWLNRMYIDNKGTGKPWFGTAVDRQLVAAYEKSTPNDLSWYLAVSQCDLYVYILATCAVNRYPNRVWKIMQYSRHYVLIEIKQGGLMVIYDMLEYLLVKAGLPSHGYVLGSDFIISSIEDHRISIDEQTSLI